MKLFPEHKGQFIAASVISVYLLVVAGASIASGSFDSLLARAGISSHSQTAALCNYVVGIGCGGGVVNVEQARITILNYNFPFYGGGGVVSLRTHGYKTRVGVWAYCKYKNLTTGQETTKTSNNDGEATVNIGNIFGDTVIKVNCTNQYNTYASSDSTTFTVTSKPAPVVTFDVPPPLSYTLMLGESAGKTISWAITNTTACRLQGPNVNEIRTGSDCETLATKTVTYAPTLPGHYGTFTYTLSYSPNNGTTWHQADSKTVVVVPPTPSTSITANGAANAIAVPYGSRATVAWQATNVEAGSCQVRNNRNSTRWYTESGSEQTPTLEQPITYTFTCDDITGNALPPKSVVISVQPALAPTCTLSANPISTTPGGSVTLNYTISGSATSANIGRTPGPNVGSVPATPTGSRTVTLGAVGTYTYRLNVTGPGGTGNCTAPVTVSAAPTGVPQLTLVAQPSRVQPGNNTSLTWTATSVTSCSLTENGVVISTQSAGTNVQRPISDTTVYTLSCIGASSASRSVTVTVLPTYVEPGQN